MTENRFFTWIWRFNGLAIAIAVTLTIGIIGWEMSRDWRRQTFPTQASEVLNIEATEASDTGSPPSEVDQTLRFDAPIFSAKRGIYAVPQYAEQEYANRGISKSSSGNRVNYLIVNTRDQSQKWLFPKASRLIIDVRDLSFKPNTGPRLLIGRLLEVVETDTNHDARLSGNDFSALYFVSPDWGQPILLTEGVDYILNSEAVSASTFEVMYMGKDGTKLTQFIYPFAKPSFEITLSDAP